jgi:dipeptidase E
MTGTLFLGGGGDAADEELLWRAMLPGRRRVLYWPFALSVEMTRGAEEWLTRSLLDLGLDTDLQTWTDLAGHHPEEMANAELLFVGGGNAFQLLHHVRRHGFEQAVQALVAGGGDYYGGSAGAILACADIAVAACLDGNEVGLSDLTGLGLTPGFVVLPHYDDDQLVGAREWSSANEVALLGIPERSGVVTRDGWVEVTGPAGVTEFNGGVVTVRYPGERWNVSGADLSP